MNMKNLPVLPTAALCVSLALSAAAEECHDYKLAFITKAKTPVTVDGRIDEDAWRRAKPITDFGPTGWSRTMKAFMPRTEVRLLWDEKYLYVAAKCFEDTPGNMAKLRLQAADKSGEVHQRDLIEFHVNGPNPGELPKLQVALTPTGLRNIIRQYDNGWGPESDGDFARVADYDLGASFGDDHWIVEARIAHASLGSTGKVGFRLGFNLGRLRFGKDFVDADTGEPTTVNYVLVHGWSSRERSQHSTANGRGIFVEDEPANVVEGLRVSYPDLDSRTVLVQTDDKYVVVRNGKTSELGYVEKARELLADALAKCDALASVSNGIPEPSKGFFSRCFSEVTANRAKVVERIDSLKGMKTCDVGLLTAVTDQCAKWAKAAEDARWTTIRNLMFAEGKVRFPVELKVDPSAPKVSEQFDYLVPRPETRRIDAPTWLKPLANGRKKVFLAVAFGDAFAAWDIMHRLDVDADVVTMEDFVHSKDLLKLSKDYRLGKGGKEKLVENLLAQNKYDAYVFLGLRLSYLTPRLQCVFAERVIGGAKLVNVNELGEWIRETTADGSLLPGIPQMTRLDRAEGTEFGTVEVPCAFPPLRRAKLGAGEYVRWQPGRSAGYREHTAFLPGWCFPPSALFNDEYDYAVGVRALAAGLGALGPARLESVTAADAAPGETVSVTVRATAGAAGAALAVALRGADGKVVTPEQALPLASAGHYDLAFAGLPTGRYFVDAFARIGDKVCDVVSGSFAVKPAHGEPCRCTPNCRGFRPAPAVVRIVPARRPFKVADKISAKVVVTNATEGLSVAAELRDPCGRVIEKGTFPVSGGLASVEFPSDRLVENCHVVALRLLDRAGATLDLAEQEVYRKIGRRDDLSVFTSGFFPGGIVGERRQAMLDYYGMSLTQDGAPTRLMFGGDAAIRHRIAGNSSQDGCSMSSPHYHDRLAKTFREMAQKIAPCNGVCISCGDDSRVPEKFENTSPDWVAPFLAALGRQLAVRAKVENLAEWQVTRRWCVEHGFSMKTGSCSDLQRRFGALNALHYLLDQPLYPNEVELFREACKAAYRGKTAIERFNLQNGVKIASWDDIDAKLITSIRPTPSSEAVNFVFWLRDEKYRGDLAKLNAFWNADVKRFEDITQETVAELAAKGRYGAELDRREYFRDLAVRQFTTIRKAVDSVDRDIAVFMGCSTYNNSAEESLAVLGSACPYWGRHKESEIYRTQLGPNALRGQTLGTYGSPRESKASREYDVWGLLLGGCNFCWFWDTFIGFRGDLGLDPGMCGYTCDELRAVKRGPASLLLRSRRDNGGVRILRAVRSGALDGLVTNGRTPAQAFKVAVGAAEGSRLAWDTIVSREVERGQLKSAKLLLLPSALLLSDKEAAEIRAFVRRGGVVLADSRPAFLAPNGSELKTGLLDDVFGIVDGKLPPAGAPVACGKGTAAILDLQGADLGPYAAKAGVKAVCAFAVDGKPVGDAEVARYVRGPVECVAWRKRPSGDERYPLAAEMRFDGKAWTYDVRAGREIGFVDAVPLELGGFDAGLLARLPYRVTGVTVSAPGEVAQGATLEIDAALVCAPAADGKAAKAGTHVFRVDLVPPCGYSPERRTPIPYRLVDAPDGRAKVKVAIAWNEPVGTVYALEVTDVATGAKAGRKITVRPAGEVKLAEDGKARAEIVLGANPVTAAQFAALELQAHLKAIAGADFPIVREDARTKGAYPIFVGAQAASAAAYDPAAFGEQDCVVDVDGTRAILFGRDNTATQKVVVVYDGGPGAIASAARIPDKWTPRGSLNAVYGFLRDRCGVRWLDCTEAGTLVPAKPTLAVREGVTRDAPFTRTRDADVNPEEWMKRRSPKEFESYRRIAYPRACAASKDPRAVETRIKTLREIFGLRLRLGGYRQHANHSFYWCYDRFWDRKSPNFIEFHPDWFSRHLKRDKQGRAVGEGVYSEVDTARRPAQMCFSNEEFLRQTLVDVRAYFDVGGYTNRYTNQGVPCSAKNPVASWGRDVYCLEPMDNGAFCECEKCRAQYRPERQADSATRSDYWFAFVNKVAREIRKSHPDRKISTLAYGGGREGLPSFKLEDNVVVHFCWDANRGPNREPLMSRQMRLMREWRKAYPQNPFGVWLYNGFPHESGTWFRYLPVPGFFGRLFDSQMKFLRDLDMRECVFHCGLRDDFELYLGGRLMWNPNEDYGKLKDEFFSSYGPAEPAVRKFYDLVEERYCNTNNYVDAQGRYRNGHMNREISWALLIRDREMGQLAAYMAEGEAAVGGGTAQEKARFANWKAGYWDYIRQAKTPVTECESPKPGVKLSKTDFYASREVPFEDRDVLEGLPFAATAAKGSGGFLWGLPKGEKPQAFKAMTTDPGFVGFWNCGTPSNLVYRCNAKIARLKRFRIVTNDSARSKFFFDLVGWRGKEKVTVLEGVEIRDAFVGTGQRAWDFEFDAETAPRDLDAIGIEERYPEAKWITNSPRYIRLRAADAGR